MFGDTLLDCLLAGAAGILLLIALPNLFLKKMHAGVWLALITALLLELYIILDEVFSNSLLMDWIGMTLLLGFTVGALFVLFGSFLLLFGFKRANLRKLTGSETVIVLGARIYNDHLSSMLVGRLEAAKRTLEAHPQMHCIVSGGKGHDEPRSEAAAMKEWLVTHGIAEDRIFCEDASTNTSENLRFSAAILKENGLPNAVIIATDFFHQYRASLFAKRAGLVSCGVSGFKEPLLIPGYWLREIIGLFHMILFQKRR